MWWMDLFQIRFHGSDNLSKAGDLWHNLTEYLYHPPRTVWSLFGPLKPSGRTFISFYLWALYYLFISATGYNTMLTTSLDNCPALCPPPPKASICPSHLMAKPPGSKLTYPSSRHRLSKLKKGEKQGSTHQTNWSLFPSPHSPSPALLVLLSLHTACSMKIIPGRLAQLDCCPRLSLCPCICVFLANPASWLLRSREEGKCMSALAWPSGSQTEILFHI